MAVSRNNTTKAGSNKPVQERLLDAAEELFCERGFEGASIRDIAASAGCNIASVNYYFGGKEKLYIEVWRRHLVQMRDARIASIDKIMSQSQAPPRLEELLTSFANAFIEPMADESRSRRLMKLMAREMIDQRLPGNMFVEEIVTPTMTAMQQALMKVCPGLDESKVPLVVSSIAGQLVHVIHIKAMFEQSGKPELAKFDLTEVVNHIVKFSAAGIRAYAEEKKE